MLRFFKRRPSPSIELDLRPNATNNAQRPVTALPAPKLIGDDLINAILASPEFQVSREYFADYPTTSLLRDGVSRAFIYLLIRAMNRNSALEIGTFRAGTTEVIARALWANGVGHVDTVDPFNYPQITSALDEWDSKIRTLCTWHNENSMAFFQMAALRRSRYDFIFIDGDHEHFAALFDIQRSAALLNHGGFLLIDNVEQPSVRLAALRFLTENGSWELLAPPEARTQNPLQPAESLVMSVPDTDFWLIRAPFRTSIDARPTCVPLALFSGIVVHGLRMQLAPQAALPNRGKISYRVSLQAIPNLDKGLEAVWAVSAATINVAALEKQGDVVTLRFEKPIDRLANHPRALEYIVMVETYLTFVGEGSLDLTQLPQPF